MKAIVIIDQSGNPHTFYEESHAIRAIKKLINDGVNFTVSHDAHKSEKVKRYGFVADNEFIERLSVQKIDDNVSIWKCQKWHLSDNVISEPEPLIIPSMMVQKRSKRHQCFFYNGEQLSSRTLSVYALDERP